MVLESGSSEYIHENHSVTVEVYSIRRFIVAGVAQVYDQSILICLFPVACPEYVVSFQWFGGSVPAAQEALPTHF